MSKHIQLRGDESSVWTLYDPVLANREIGIEDDTGLFKIGDGVTRWTSVGYFTGYAPAAVAAAVSAAIATLNLGTAATQPIGAFASPALVANQIAAQHAVDQGLYVATGSITSAVDNGDGTATVTGPVLQDHANGTATLG